MTRKTDPKLGNDPLAWMEEGTDGNVALRAEPKPVERRVNRRRKADQAVDLGLPVQVLEDSFALLAPQAEQLVARFYDELFRRYPAVEPLFRHTTRADQQRKLLAALKLMVNNLRKPEALVKALQEMGARHQGYGAHPDHYRAVADTLLDVMAELAGDAWTDEVEAAWEQALSVVAETMLKAYKPVEEVKMAARKEDVKSRVAKESADGVMNDIGALTRILEDAAVNVMIADADENIVFVNRRARQVLTELEDELATYLPGFRADEVVGGSIHRYHKDPDAIRRILARLQPGDVREGEITPGPFVFEHETRVLTDAAGNRMGYVVQWHDATEMRRREEQAQRLQRAIDGAQTAMMTINRDLVIEYVNGETRDLMRRNAEDLRKLYPGFDPENLVGTCIDIFHKNPAHQRQLLANPANLPFETDIHVGHLTFHIRVSAINDLKGEYVGCTLEWSDVTNLRERETEVARLMSAVEGATANLMMCDEDLNITYCNPAVMELFRNRAGELRQVFPGFDPNNLVGQNIDKFHRNPAHQRALLSDASRLPAKADIKVLDIEFQVNATMITGPNGEYMGNMVEWKDITEQKDAERQIERLIEAAVQGSLEQRIDTDQYAGFMKGLGTGINHLLDAVVEPMRESTRVMKSLAEGDLTQAMEGEFNGEFADMRDAVNASVANLMQMVAEIRSASTNITSAASEISQGNADLSQRTEEQASSLEETASSMEELTSTVRQNADNARQANQLASGAREQAEKGGDVVGKAVEAMVEINSASKKIAEIIGVIDEIAFQTNLLALNAAVEAARAGEQGRGFAVVAAEVRNLAQRSAGAAKEIKALIKDSVDKVDEGSRLVDESGKTLGDIVTAVKKVSDIIAEIAAASQEQSAGIEQVNKAVMQLDEMTQQNAALVEEAAAASEALDDQAQGLNQRMSFFNVGDLAEAAPAPVQRRSRPASGRAAAARPAAGRRPNPVSGRAVPPSSQAEDDGEWEDF